MRSHAWLVKHLKMFPVLCETYVMRISMPKYEPYGYYQKPGLGFRKGRKFKFCLKSKIKILDVEIFVIQI